MASLVCCCILEVSIDIDQAAMLHIWTMEQSDVCPYCLHAG